MVLYSFIFLFFFFFLFVVFWKLPKHYRWILLLGFSYYFYASWKPAYLGIILLTTLVSFYCAILMHKKRHHKGRYLLLALVINLGILFTFKYFNFFAITIDQTLGATLPQFELLLPLGISFYTLQVIGYLVDVYKGKTVPEKHLGVLALFVCFFPQLSAGPIERSTTLLPQLKKMPDFQYSQVTDGAKLFLLGLFKKIVIADNLAIVVDRTFSALPDHKGLSLIIVIFLYTWQIYMDFSGYTDMARGIAKMVGINLIENFNAPYLARSVQDFWRRWHISFSTWLRDYIYFPLGGSRHGLLRTVLNTFIVFIVSGLWHGAAWTFVIWGVLHGAGIAFERVMKKFFGGRFTVPIIVQIAYAYCLVSIFWIFFRANTVSDAFYVLRNAFVGVRNFFSPDYIMATLNQLFVYNKIEMYITFGLVAIAILFEVMQRKNHVLKILDTKPIVIRFAVYTILLFLIFQLRNAEIKEFIYVKF